MEFKIWFNKFHLWENHDLFTIIEVELSYQILIGAEDVEIVLKNKEILLKVIESWYVLQIESHLNLWAVILQEVCNGKSWFVNAEPKLLFSSDVNHNNVY